MHVVNKFGVALGFLIMGLAIFAEGKFYIVLDRFPPTVELPPTSLLWRISVGVLGLIILIKSFKSS